MSEKDNLLSKLIKEYDDSKNRKIKGLDDRRENLRLKLKSEKMAFKQLTDKKKRLELEYANLDLELNSLLIILKARGIIFDIPNRKLQIKEWDNLYLRKIDNLYNFVNRSGVSLYILDKKYYEVMDYIVKNYSYSIVVIRKNPHYLKVQLRIVE